MATKCTHTLTTNNGLTMRLKLQQQLLEQLSIELTKQIPRDYFLSLFFSPSPSCRCLLSCKKQQPKSLTRPWLGGKLSSRVSPQSANLI